MGVGAQDVLGRVAASIGDLDSVAPEFQAVVDVPKGWSAELCRYWMELAPEQAGVLYIDGHVRVYNGQQTQLPKHHVARQKLCLRATTDYWVNAMDGQPFMVINKVVDPGLIKVIENDIVPELEERVPKQTERTSAATLPYPHKFTLVFDREGYSPEFMARMKTKQVAVLTYHKHPGENWPESEFNEQTLILPTGETTQVKLAERGVCLSNGLWVREIRKLSERGHQTAVLATDYQANLTVIGARMFARWSQENYFKYMREHYGLDKLADYSTEEITEPMQVVNPAYRDLDGKVRSQVGKLSRMMAQFGAMHFEGTLDDEELVAFMRKKATLQEEIEQQKKAWRRSKAHEKKRHIILI
jgi:hypothetical protein